jgi:type III pantothenate kinase
VLLTIDVGNSNTVLGVFDGAELKAHWRLTTRREQTPDEYGILVRGLFADNGLDPRGIEAVALASVVPPLTPVLVELARHYLGKEPLVIGPGVRTGMPILYEPRATWVPTASSTAWRLSRSTEGPRSWSTSARRRRST